MIPITKVFIHEHLKFPRVQIGWVVYPKQVLFLISFLLSQLNIGLSGRNEAILCASHRVLGTRDGVMLLVSYGL